MSDLSIQEIVGPVVDALNAAVKAGEDPVIVGATPQQILFPECGARILWDDALPPGVWYADYPDPTA